MANTNQYKMTNEETGCLGFIVGAVLAFLLVIVCYQIGVFHIRSEDKIQPSMQIKIDNTGKADTVYFYSNW